MDNQYILLQNDLISVAIDRCKGSVASILDKKTDAIYLMSGIGFIVETDRGVISSDSSFHTEAREEAVALSFLSSGVEVTLHYTLGNGHRFMEKWMDIRTVDGTPCFLRKVILEDVRFESAFHEIHFHDDQTIWHCPINLFMRCEKGGCFAGLEYPYWENDLRGTEGFRLGYEPNYPVVQGEVNTSEKYFLGVYQMEGIYRYSHGPYPGKVKTMYDTWTGTGLTQHFKDYKIPEAALEQEVLDWGEVWAMQDFMRHVLPEQPLPEEGYWIWQNGWWAGLFEIDKGQLDRLREAGIHDVMTAHTWYGHDLHPNTEPLYLNNMRMEPMGFPLPTELTGNESLPIPKESGWHVKNDPLGKEYNHATTFEDEFRAPEKFEEYIAYGRMIGVHVNSFSLPNLYFEQHPEWGHIDCDGKPGMYIFGGRVSCPACDEYMDFLQKLYKYLFDKYQPRWWGWDGRWLSYWEVALTPNLGDARPDPCYATHHGHVPGAGRYSEGLHRNFSLV